MPGLIREESRNERLHEEHLRYSSGRPSPTTAFLPGLMDTGALKPVRDARVRTKRITPEEAKAAIAKSVPIRRLGTAVDSGPVYAFLYSISAAYMTGQNITLDGGLSKPLL